MYEYGDDSWRDDDVDNAWYDGDDDDSGVWYNPPDDEEYGDD